MSVPMLIERLNKQDKDRTLQIRMNKNNLNIHKTREWEVNIFPEGIRLDFNGKIHECAGGSVIIGSFGMAPQSKKTMVIFNILFLMAAVLIFSEKDDFIVDLFILGILQLIFAWILKEIYVLIAR